VSVSVPVWMWIVGFLLVLGPLVTLHELGHYIAGRFFGVKSDVFSVGFGKEIVGFTDKRGTRWKIAALPLGGYVQFAGDMNPASVPDREALAKVSPQERRENFHFKPLWQRAVIVFAGPLTNLLIALAIFAGFFMAFGQPVPVDPADTALVKKFAEVSVAREAGMRIGDRIVAIDGQRVSEFRDIQDRVALYPNKRIVVGIERSGAGRLDIPVTIQGSEETDQFGNKAVIGRLGVYSSPFEFQAVGVGEALTLSVEHSVGLVRMMATGLAQIVVGDRSIKELGGPIKIAKFSGEQLSLGPLPFVEFIALISINLAFINLLPIPALDGGHLAFYAAEAVRRKPLGQRSQEWAFRTGIGLVLALMLFVTINDIASLPIFGS
jgi:regulator of sigma E protease